MIREERASKDPDEIMISTGYNPNSSIVSNSRPEIINDFENLNVRSEIICGAKNVYYRIIASKSLTNQKPTRIKSVKGSKKLKLIFYCVYIAHLDLGRAVDPCYVADLVNLDYKEIDRSFENYSENGIITIEPERLIPFYIERLNEVSKESGIVYDKEKIIDGVNKVITICKSTQIGKEALENIPSRFVAICSLYFFLDRVSRTNISKEITNFEKACYLSWGCIKRYLAQIEKYYNAKDKDPKKFNITLT